VRRSSCPGAVTGRFTYASSDEGANADGSGDQAPDLIFSGCSNIDVRVERMASSNGRVYRLGYDVVDACGQRLVGACNVEVPHDQSGADAIPGAESYRVNAPSTCGN
jgi:hypothetical protein